MTDEEEASGSRPTPPPSPIPTIMKQTMKQKPLIVQHLLTMTSLAVPEPVRRGSATF